MTEAELIKAQSVLIEAQQKFISMMSVGNSSDISFNSISKNTEPKEDKKEITLAEYAKTFMKSRENTVKPSTYHNYVWMLKKAIIPILGEVEICKIDNRCLQNFADNLLKTLAKKSVRDMVGLVKTILTDAYINDVVEPKSLQSNTQKVKRKITKLFRKRILKNLNNTFFRRKNHMI